MTKTAAEATVALPRPVLRAHELTIEQYVCLRLITQRGDFPLHELKKRFEPSLIQSLKDGGILTDSYRHTHGSSVVHPTNHGRAQLEHARAILGITEL